MNEYYHIAGFEENTKRALADAFCDRSDQRGGAGASTGLEGCHVEEKERQH